MSKTLAICVSSTEHMDKLINLCSAAKKKDVKVSLFLTHIATRLTKHPRFGELLEVANVALCHVGFESQKLKKPVLGLDEKAYASQSFHAEMILDCDQYLAF